MLNVYDIFIELNIFISGGSTVTLKTADLITGFYSPMALRISNPAQLNFYNGDAIYYNPYCTIALTNYVGVLTK